MYTKRTKDEIHCTYSGVKCTQTYKIYSCRRFWYTLWPIQNDGQSTLSSHDCARRENETTLIKIRVCQFLRIAGVFLWRHLDFTCCYFFWKYVKFAITNPLYNIKWVWHLIFCHMDVLHTTVWIIAQ